MTGCRAGPHAAGLEVVNKNKTGLQQGGTCWTALRASEAVLQRGMVALRRRMQPLAMLIESAHLYLTLARHCSQAERRFECVQFSRFPCHANPSGAWLQKP